MAKVTPRIDRKRVTEDRFRGSPGSRLRVTCAGQDHESRRRNPQDPGSRPEPDEKAHDRECRAKHRNIEIVIGHGGKILKLEGDESQNRCDRKADNRPPTSREWTPRRANVWWGWPWTIKR